MPVGREGILIESVLGGSTAAPPIAPVVKEEDRQTDVMKFREIVQTMDDVARIPVAPEEYRCGGGRGNKPAKQLGPVGGLK